MHLVVLFITFCWIDAFAPLHLRQRHSFVLPSFASRQLDEIRSLSIREIKQELASLQVSTKDAFEKEELVKRLADARQPSSSTSTTDEVVLETPLFLTTPDEQIEMAGNNLAPHERFTMEPSSQPYPTIQIQLQDGRTLNLLLDTACSGFVLRPETVQRYNLPTFSTPVTMTGAGGTTGATGLSQLQDFTLLGEKRQIFGKLPAAVTDIGALPRSLDGIIGLSFLQQFAQIELDFVRGVLLLNKNVVTGDKTNCVASAPMSLLPLGIYTADVFFGKRGPVKMIVDTGAACTLLNWKGVADLGLSKTCEFISPLRQSTGALGSDNVAISLTHRLHVSSQLHLGSKTAWPGLSLEAEKRLAIDVGEIPILGGLQSQGVGGILGMDALMRASIVRFGLKNQTPSISLLQ
jgi:predicted aspartyl protease